MTSILKKNIIANGLTAMLVLATAFLGSCSKKDLCLLPHPHDSRICHTQITLNFNPDWDGDLITSYTRTTETMQMRYLMEFWEVDENGSLTNLIERTEVTETANAAYPNSQVVSVDLPAFRMAVLCWAEPLVGEAAANACFDATDLRSVKLLAPYGKVAGKDAFTASAIWDFTPHCYELDGIDLTESIELLRPFGSYALISNDVDEYFEKNGTAAPLPTYVKADYSLYVPETYDVYRQIPANPKAGMSFDYTVTNFTDDGKELNMAEDLIFIGTQDAEHNYYNVMITSFAANDEKVHESGNVEIKMQRNKRTLVYGAYLTTRNTNSPGVDDSFDDYEDIVIPD